MKKEGSSYAHGTTHGILPRKEPRMEDRRETKTSQRGIKEREEPEEERRRQMQEQDRIDDEIRQGGPMVCYG